MQYLHFVCDSIRQGGNWVYGASPIVNCEVKDDSVVISMRKDGKVIREIYEAVFNSSKTNEGLFVSTQRRMSQIVAHEVPDHLFGIYNWLSVNKLDDLTLIPEGKQPLLSREAGDFTSYKEETAAPKTVRSVYNTDEGGLVLQIGGWNNSELGSCGTVFFQINKPSAQIVDGRTMKLFDNNKQVFEFKVAKN